MLFLLDCYNPNAFLICCLIQASIVELAQSILSGRSSTVPLSSRPVVSAQCDASSSGSTGANDFIDTAESSEGNEFIQIADFMSICDVNMLCQYVIIYSYVNIPIKSLNMYII